MAGLTLGSYAVQDVLDQFDSCLTGGQGGFFLVIILANEITVSVCGTDRLAHSAGTLKLYGTHFAAGLCR